MEIETTRVDTFGQGCRKYRFAFSRAPFFQFAVFGGNLEQSPSYHINKIIALHSESKLSTYQKSHIPTPVVSAYQVWILTFLHNPAIRTYVLVVSLFCASSPFHTIAVLIDTLYLVRGTRETGKHDSSVASGQWANRQNVISEVVGNRKRFETKKWSQCFTKNNRIFVHFAEIFLEIHIIRTSEIGDTRRAGYGTWYDFSRLWVPVRVLPFFLRASYLIIFRRVDKKK